MNTNKNKEIFFYLETQQRFDLISIMKIQDLHSFSYEIIY